MTIALPRPQLPKVVDALPVEEPNVNDLVEKTTALRALNQLMSLVSGSRISRETEHLKAEPLQRSLVAWKAVIAEAERTGENSVRDAAAMKRLQAMGTKMESLGSLIVLSKLVSETEW